MKRLFSVGILVLMLLCNRADALRWGGRTTEPLNDENWPLGAVQVANLKSRIGYMGGDPGWVDLYYQGDTEAFQEALNQFAAIRWRELKLVICDGPYKLIGFTTPGMGNERLDWTVHLQDAQGWQRFNANPTVPLIGMGSNDFRSPYPPPTMNVYVGGGQIDWSKIKVPSNVSVTEERADAAGFQSGPVVRAEIYDVMTSKPIPGAQIAVGTSPSQDTWTLVQSATGDAQGRAVLQGFPPGSLRVVAFAEGYAPKTVQWVEFRTNTFKQFSVFLAPAATLMGTIVDLDGKPVPGVKVTPSSMLGPDGQNYLLTERLTLEQTTDERGYFKISGLPRGYVHLNANEVSHWIVEPFKVYPVPSNISIVLHMTSTGAIHVRVVDQQGKPVASGHIDVSVPGPDRVGTWGGSAQLKPDGTYNFDRVPPGKYVVSQNPQLPGVASDPNAKEITVTAGQTVEVEIHR